MAVSYSPRLVIVYFYNNISVPYKRARVDCRAYLSAVYAYCTR